MAKKTKQSVNPMEILRYLWKHKIILTFVVFFIYLAFFDKYNLNTQYKLYSGLAKLEYNKADYIKKIAQAKRDKWAIEKDYEKFARERYLMSRPDEDIFVIEKKDKD